MRKQVSFLTSRARLRLQNPVPFAVLVGAALLYVGALVSGLAEDILDTENIVLADGWLVHWLAARRTPTGIGSFEAVTFVGSWQVVLIVLTSAVIFLWDRRRRSALSILVAVAGSQLVVSLGKAGFGRPRPPAVLAVLTPLDASFPSGHASISVALYTLGFYLLFRAARSRQDSRGSGWPWHFSSLC